MSTSYKQLLHLFITDYHDSIKVNQLSLVHHSSYSCIYKVDINGRSLCLKIQLGHKGKEMLNSQVEQIKYLLFHNINTPTIVNFIDHYPLGAILITEYIDPAPNNKTGQYNLGLEVAKLHQIKHNQFGWHSDNFIGTCNQINAQLINWNNFLLNNRFIYQIKFAVDNQLINIATSKEFIQTISYFLEAHQINIEPALLHGDLWSGNYIIDSKDNKAYLIDPAIYFGHIYMDLAMTHLFGGFDAPFYELIILLFQIIKRSRCGLICTKYTTYWCI